MGEMKKMRGRGGEEEEKRREVVLINPASPTNDAAVTRASRFTCTDM